MAPAGYETAEAISFTVSEYGEVERVVMEDKRKEESKEPKPEKPKPEEPKPEEPKPEPEPEPEPQKPDQPKGPPTKTIHVRTKPEEPKPQTERKVGRILASYQADRDGEGVLHLRQKDRQYIRLPKTGDDRQPEAYLFGLAVSTVMLLGLALTRRKRDEK